MALEIQVTFDVADLDRMAAFWALALGYEPEPPPEGKTAKNRVHIDIRSSAIAAEGEDPRDHARAHAATLVEAGATILHEKDEPIGWSIVMQDPEGNEFCVT
jgi:Glyoxalase-like domain